MDELRQEVAAGKAASAGLPKGSGAVAAAAAIVTLNSASGGTGLRVGCNLHLWWIPIPHPSTPIHTGEAPWSGSVVRNLEDELAARTSDLQRAEERVSQLESRISELNAAAASSSLSSAGAAIAVVATVASSSVSAEEAAAGKQRAEEAERRVSELEQLLAESSRRADGLQVWKGELHPRYVPPHFGIPHLDSTCEAHGTA